MSKNTCGNCEHLKITSMMRGMMYTASCGMTDDGFIVPYHWASETITLWRVPEFCKNPDKVKSKKQAPRKDWVRINIKDI